MERHPSRPSDTGTLRPKHARAARRHRSQRGAALIEAAIVLPLMITILIGILEFGLLFTTYSTTSASTRSGARVAATAYAQAGSVTSKQEAAAESISLATAADLLVLNNAEPVGMAIYKVNANSANGAPTGGFPGADMAGGCTSRCIRYEWDPTTDEMDYVSGAWTDADACGVTVDSIGVFVQAQHDYVTGFFGSTRTVNGHTVMRLEPLPTDQCSGENPG